MARPAVDHDFSAVGFDDAIADRQAQAQTTSFLRGEKWLKDSRQEIGIDTHAGVCHRDSQLIG